MGKTAQEVTEPVTFGLGRPAPEPSLLERLRIRPGAAVLYLGCPEPGSIASTAGQVGPAGAVTVVDDDVPATAAARRLVIDRNLANVEILRRASWHDLFEPESFAVVHVHRSLATGRRRQRRRLLRGAVRLAKPGGWVVSGERRSALDRSPWTVTRLFGDCGLDAVSTEPARGGAIDLATGSGDLEYLVWGHKAAQ
jgi:16S rRNA G1207 methylase RsmC